MKGIELSEEYFDRFGLPMLEREFAPLLPYLAAGLVGEGSECFGYDDAVSTDHDFEPGFCLFLPEEDVIDRRTAFLLEKAYAKLPKEYGGYRKSAVAPVGGPRHGVMRISDFYIKKCGRKDGILSFSDWFALPEYALAEATNGKVFMDRYGTFSAIRARLLAMPDDVRKKKLAGRLLLAGQSGQYNYARTLAHGERGAGQFALFEFAQSAMACAFLLDRRYMPYYKWSFCALRELPRFSHLAAQLETLLTTGNGEAEAKMKQETVEEIAAALIRALREDGLTEDTSGDLERHAYAVNATIRDANTRNLHILSAVP